MFLPKAIDRGATQNNTKPLPPIYVWYLRCFRRVFRFYGKVNRMQISCENITITYNINFLSMTGHSTGHKRSKFSGFRFNISKTCWACTHQYISQLFMAAVRFLSLRGLLIPCHSKWHSCGGEEYNSSNQLGIISDENLDKATIPWLHQQNDRQR